MMTTEGENDVDEDSGLVCSRWIVRGTSVTVGDNTVGVTVGVVL